jgi:septum formation protein
VVAVDDQVLGKPCDRLHAAAMLGQLSGRGHMVYTGVTLCQGTRIHTQHEATAVRFRPLTGEEIACYVATGEPMDKAGAYGIQGYGALLVEEIRGDYYNVVGLPVCRLGRMLAEFGVDALALAKKERTT